METVFALFLTLDKLRGNDDIAMALGNMIVAWSHAEEALVLAMSVVGRIDIDQAAHGFYRIPTFESRVKFILAMIPWWNDATFDKAALTKAIDALSKLASTRNGWVHNTWVADVSVGGGEIYIINQRAPRGSSFYKPVKVHDICFHSETVIKRTEELFELLGSRLPETPPQDSDRTRSR